MNVVTTKEIKKFDMSIDGNKEWVAKDEALRKVEQLKQKLIGFTFDYEEACKIIDEVFCAEKKRGEKKCKDKR